jgi:hypothetical protein
MWKGGNEANVSLTSEAALHEKKLSSAWQKSFVARHSFQGRVAVFISFVTFATAFASYRALIYVGVFLSASGAFTRTVFVDDEDADALPVRRRWESSWQQH